MSGGAHAQRSGNQQSQAPQHDLVRSLVCGPEMQEKSRTAIVETEFITAISAESNAPDQGRKDVPANSRRQEIAQESRRRSLRRVRDAGVKRQRDDAGQGEDEDRRQLQQHGEHRAPAGLFQVPGPSIRWTLTWSMPQ